MHYGLEWGESDGRRAEAFYRSLAKNRKLIFDLMMDRPGELLDSSWIAAQIGGSVNSSLSPIRRAYEESGRRLPFDWWRRGEGSQYAMKKAVAKLFRQAREKVDPSFAMLATGADWSDAEVRATVEDYLVMLRAELSGQTYSKAAHRRALSQKLNAKRTASAIEFKHQNISAAMLDLGLPYIQGYKPMGNYQAALSGEIRRRVETRPPLLALLRVDPGDLVQNSRLQRVGTLPRARENRRGRHPDYGLLQEENRRWGALGEQLVVEYERSQLRHRGRPDLAERVRWTAKEDGDGLGYDICSFRADGHVRYIEVKTTRLGADTPFYISSAELSFAERHPDSYALYRVFGVPDAPQFFELEGDVGNVLELSAVTYRASLATTGQAVEDERSSHAASGS